MGFQLYRSSNVPLPPSEATGESYKLWADAVTDELNSLSQFVFDVRDFDARGDGQHDDTNAIRAAISAATTAGGGTVYFPATEANEYLTSGISINGITGINLEGASSNFSAPILKFTGSSNSAVLELKAARYCSVENLRIDGVSEASFGVYIHGASTYECRFKEVFVGNCVRGFSIGSANNLQASEIDLYNCYVSTCSTGVDISGFNTLNIRSYGLKVESCNTGVKLGGGNLIACGTLFVVQTSADIELGANPRPNAFYGGETEQGTGRFLYAAPNGNNFQTAFHDFHIGADSSNNTVDFVNDNSLYHIRYSNCYFDAGAGVNISGFGAVPSTRTFGRKVFDNCVWATSDSTVVAPQISGAWNNCSVITEAQNFHL